MLESSMMTGVATEGIAVDIFRIQRVKCYNWLKIIIKNETEAREYSLRLFYYLNEEEGSI
jgi:hypothetical protein